MNADSMRTLFGYNVWAHRQVWECVMHLTDAQFLQDVDYSIGSVRNHLVHVMSVDQRWFARIAGDDVPPRLNPAEFTTRAAVRTRWDEIEARNHSLMVSLNDAGFATPITYQMREVTYTSPTWHIVAHVVNHGTDHRSQLLRVLHDFGAPTVEQDMSFYLVSHT